MALATLVTGVIVASYGLFEARPAQQRAEREAAAAEQVSDFLKELFEGSDPSEALGETITARNLLDRGRQRIAEILADEPAVRARLTATLGEVYASLGERDLGIELLEEAVDLGQEHLEPTDPALGDMLYELGLRYSLSGRMTRAEGPLRQALVIQEQAHGRESRQVANTLNRLSYFLASKGRFEESVPLGVEALEISEALLAPDDPKLADVNGI